MPKYVSSTQQPLPTLADLQQPSEPPAAPYFTSWLRPQIIAAVEKAYHVPQKIAEYRAYYGGLKIRTTLDLQLQQAAQQAIDAEFPPGSNGPTAALVAIDNRTGEVRAMVSGASGSWNQSQFNLATQGHRQPGSAFKVFTLAEALRTGEYGPSSVIDSAPQDFIVPNSGGKEHFIVHNFGNTYSGPITLQEATDISDNTVFSQVGIHVGTLRIARLATQMGIRSYISHNYAMILGGLKIGVSPLDMAHAYETLAMGGVKVYNPLLGDNLSHRGNPEEQAGPGPTGIHSITCTTSGCGHIGQTITDTPTYKRILPAWVAATEHSMLEGVVSQGGTAPLAAIPGVIVAGKTGTTSNYGDAWFVGWTPQMTTAVWVGYPTKLVPMTTAYNGGPGRRWHVPGDHLEQLHDAGPPDPRDRAGGGAAREGRNHYDDHQRLGIWGRYGREPDGHRDRSEQRDRKRRCHRQQRHRKPTTPAARAARPVAAQAATPAGAPEAAPAATPAAVPGAAPAGGPEAVPAAALAVVAAVVPEAVPEAAGLAAPAGTPAAPESAAAPAASPPRRGHAGRGQASSEAAPRQSESGRRRTPGRGQRAGRDRNLLALAEKRHGRSAAFVIPIRRLTVIAGSRHARGRDEIRSGPRIRSAPLHSSPTASASVSFPGPEHSPATDLIPGRRARITSIPSTGSSARIRLQHRSPAARRRRSAARGSRTSCIRTPLPAARTESRSAESRR